MRAWFVILALIPIPVCHAQEPTRIRVPVRLVTAPTMVFSKEGQFVFGVQKDDFRLYDNGRPQKLNLDPDRPSLSVAVVVQTNQNVRAYLPFVAKVGSVVDSLLLGASGEAAVLTYNDEVTLKKPFETGDVHSAFKDISASGQKARMIDAGMQALALLKLRPGARSRILLLIGQPMDNGSDYKLAAEDTVVYALTLPEVGKAFVSDTFSLKGFGSQYYKGGYQASVELTKLLPALKRSGKEAAGKDPFAALTSATGGTQLHFRKQGQLEDAITAIGTELRSTYLLSYSPDSRESGYHRISIEVDVPGARVYSRPGYNSKAIGN